MTQLPRFTSGTIGRLRYDHINTVFDVVDRVYPHLPDIEGEPGRLPARESRTFLAKITGSSAIGGEANRWEYDFEQVSYDRDSYAFTTKTDGWTSAEDSVRSDDRPEIKAINLLEGHNTGAGDEGMGVDVDDTGTSCDAVGSALVSDLTMVPIMDNCIVEMTATNDSTGKLYFHFSAPNAYCVECPP